MSERPSRADLAAAVASAPVGELLPTARAADADRVVGQLRLLDACPLPGGRWQVTVLEAASGGLFVAPLEVSGGRARRARPGDGAAEALVELLAGERRGAWGRFRVEALHPRPVRGERGLDVDQTNESCVVGESGVVKWLVHAARAEHPAPRLLSHLDAVGFDAIPRPWGWLTWTHPEGDDVLVASTDAYLAGATDGWTWCVSDVRRFAEGSLDSQAALAPVRLLGEIVARLHLALATPSRTIAEPVAASTADQVRAWHERARTVLAEAVALTPGDTGRRLQERAARATAVLDTLRLVTGTPVTPVHGDLHVGQVLRFGDAPTHRYAVTDFDGNPVLPPQERLERQPPARDVAGMLQSLDHVGRVVVRRCEGVDPGAVQSWMDAAAAEFLACYRGALAAGGRPELLDEHLLLPMRVEQECREFVYAARHLPRWQYVPDEAMAALIP